MEQYNQDTADTSVTPIKATEESKQIHTVDARVKRLEEALGLQHHEIIKLRRDINRLKSEISDVITVLKDRG